LTHIDSKRIYEQVGFDIKNRTE